MAGFDDRIRQKENEDLSHADSTHAMSIIIPSFNSMPYVRPCLESIADVPDIEVIFQDGGSTDGSVDEARRTDLSNCQVICEPDTGQADALNRALSRATGKYIGWLNADDIYYAPAVRTICNIVRGVNEHDGDGPDVIYGDFNVIGAGGEIVRRYRSGRWSTDRIFRRGCYIFSGATFIRRELLQSVKFNSSLRYAMDLDLYLRMGQVRTMQIHQPVGALRIHDRSKTGSEAKNFAIEALNVRDAISRGAIKRAVSRSVYLRTLITVALQPVRFSSFYSTIRRQKDL